MAEINMFLAPSSTKWQYYPMLILIRNSSRFKNTFNVNILKKRAKINQKFSLCQWKFTDKSIFSDTTNRLSSSLSIWAEVYDCLKLWKTIKSNHGGFRLFFGYSMMIINKRIVNITYAFVWKIYNKMITHFFAFN